MATKQKTKAPDNRYFVVRSKSPYLLAMASTVFKMMGYKNARVVSEKEDHPFFEIKKDKLAINHPENGRKTFSFWSIELRENGQTNFTLTEKNYIKVLSEILKNK